MPKRENCFAVLPFWHPHVEPNLAQRARLGSHFASKATGARSGSPRAKIFAEGEIPVAVLPFCACHTTHPRAPREIGFAFCEQSDLSSLGVAASKNLRRRRNSRVNNRIADSNLFCPLRPHARPALPKGEPFRIKAYDFPGFNLPKQKTTSSDA